MSFPSPNPNLPLFLLLLFLLSQSVKSDHPIASSIIQLPSETEYDPVESLICPIDSGPVGSCPVKCFRPDPVCGDDNVTYWCGCPDALCSGARVVKVGFCEVGNGGSGQALLLVHIVWLVFLGIFLLCGLL